jgi:DNA-binding protein YbaB
MDMRLLMKQAQKMQEKMQKEIAALSVEGTSGGGMVTIQMAGNHAVTKVGIKPEAVASNDAEMLEDLGPRRAERGASQARRGPAGEMGSLKMPGSASRIPGPRPMQFAAPPRKTDRNACGSSRRGQKSAQRLAFYICAATPRTRAPWRRRSSR